MKRLAQALTLASLLIVIGSAGAAASGPAGSPLPGYPRFRGVMLVHDGSSANARERAIASALKAAPSTNPNCTIKGTNPGADLCWWGGPVVKAHTVHLIFWEGPTGPAFPPEYIEEVETYFSRLAFAGKTPSEADSSVFAVPTQYEGSNGPLTFKPTFASPTDVFLDKADPLPTAGTLPTECKDSAFATCITDEDLHHEIEAAELVEGWTSSREDLFFVLTPPNVGSCFEPGSSSEGDVCALVEGGYCAYHGDFGASGKETIYGNIPDVGNVEGCDFFEHPNGAGGVDATLGAMSHEHNEILTDPLEKEPAWLDVIGQEVGDKCLPPETFDIYGGILGGSLGAGTLAEPGTAYNQIIGGGHYLLQREWSNRAFSGEGGCVQRMFPTAFTLPTEAKATVPATFDGSPSGEVGDPAVYWVWSFGDGMQTGTPEAKTSHTYAISGNYRVTLTAFDAYGNSNTHTMSVEVGYAPPPVLAPSTQAAVVDTVTVTTPPPATLAYTAAQIGEKLGLPSNGTKFSGLGTISLGHAECPPACTVVVRLYATKRVTVHHGRFLKRVFIGALTTTIAMKGTGTLALRLNADGLKLLHKSRRLPSQLTVTITGREGGSWVLQRTLTLTSSARSARHRR